MEGARVWRDATLQLRLRFWVVRRHVALWGYGPQYVCTQVHGRLSARTLLHSVHNHGYGLTHTTHSENEHQCIKNKDCSKSTNKQIECKKRQHRTRKRSSTIYHNHNNNNPLRLESFVTSSLNLHDHLPHCRRYICHPIDATSVTPSTLLSIPSRQTEAPYTEAATRSACAHG